MAKGARKQQKKRSPRKRSRAARPAMPRGLIQKQLDYARLLADPCNAKVPVGVYPGEVGLVQRFVSENTMVGTGNTAAYLAFHPNTGWLMYSNVATSSGVSAATFTSTVSPGATYLTTNAQTVRGLASCIQLTCSALSITSITGEIAFGNVPAAFLYSSGTAAVDYWFQNLQGRGAISRDIKECKWTPGKRDNDYSTYVSGSSQATWATTGSDFQDTNFLVVAVRNLPLNTFVNIRITHVVEYTTKPGLGITPMNVNAPGTNHLAVTAAMHASKPSWWHNLQEDAGAAMSGFASAFIGSASNNAGKYASNKLAGWLSGAGRSAGQYAITSIEEVAEESALALL